MNRISTHWNDDMGVAVCTIIISNGDKVTGYAECSEKDKDMISEKVGCTIAEKRAYIEYLRYIRDKELKPELKALNKFYNVINQSKYYNEQDYSNQMLLRNIKRLEDDLAALKEEIQEEKQSLKNYINEKETFYQNVRKYRGKSKQAENG